ncbi:tyrosine-type recombinase/integrase [Blastochloris tepida]|uniref:Tyr recombinase domain-containing protein n=1 Tax=Blastochloris tepida TaxID=2233851 RepID=A0A348G3T3_9HYPH|nr:tyrosine-type recombinase/integrase [Blastochloris tepida]BBF94216.1 hypothetical protein BLTE_29010 [Blastochloris tepida]
MPRPSSADTRYLELKDGKWRVTVPVPRHLHKKLGTRLKRPLHTDSLATANALKWQVVAELKGMIDREGANTLRHRMTREALELAAQRARAVTPSEIERIDDWIDEQVDHIRGEPIEIIEYADRAVPIYDPNALRMAETFREMAMGEATPIELHHQAYLDQLTVKRRTKADDERAMKFLLTWCKNKGVSPMLQAITGKVAARFMDELHTVAGSRHPVTLQKYINRLSVYWKWLKQRSHVETNPWADLKLPVPKTPHNELERSFTDAEVARLLQGSASQAMHDLMRIAALTGARLDAIVDLSIGDCADGAFKFKPQKKEKQPRYVPIHSALKEIIARRTVGKAPTDDLFPEYPPPKKATSKRERSFKASTAFTTYRRSVGVADEAPGRRRSLVNFHSFRRWFITKAERAGQAEHIIASVVGHARPGMTLGRYSAGPEFEQLRVCVEAVSLPAGPAEDSCGPPEEMAVAAE